MMKSLMAVAMAVVFATPALAEGDAGQATVAAAIAVTPAVSYTLAPAPHVPMRTVPALVPNIDESLLAAQPVRRRNARPGWTISD